MVAFNVWETFIASAKKCYTGWSCNSLFRKLLFFLKMHTYAIVTCVLKPVQDFDSQVELHY